MHIQINTADELTEQDRAILLALAGVTETPSGVLLAEEAKPETPKKRAPRKPKELAEKEVDADAAMLAKHASSAIGVVDEPEPAPTPEPEEEPKETPTLDEVANVATAFIRNGKRDEVAKILNEDLGVEKVTALKNSPEKVPELLDLLVNFYNELKADAKSKKTAEGVRQMIQLNEDAAPLFLARTEA